MNCDQELGDRLVGLSVPAYQLAVHILGSRDDAEDALQQAYANALRNAPPAMPPEELRTWFLTVVANAARDQLKTETRRKRREALMSREELQTDSPGKPDTEVVAALRRAMAELDERHRLPLALCYEQGLSQRQAAAVLGVHVSTISERLEAGLARLKTMLNEAGYAAIAGAALTESLRLAAPEVPAGLTAFVESLIAAGGAKAAGAAAAGATAAAAAAGASLAAGWKVAVGLGLAALLGWGGREIWKRWAPMTVPAAASTETPALTRADLRWESVDIAPRGAGAWEACEELRRKELRVLLLGRERPVMGRALNYELFRKRRLRVPPDLRGRTVTAREFIGQVAELHGLKVDLRGNRAVLYEGAGDEKVARILQGLGSREVAGRIEAAWLAGWAEDIRVLGPLAGALQDEDGEVRSLAARSLRRLGLDAALAVAGTGGEELWDLLKEDMADWSPDVQRRALQQIGDFGGEKACALVPQPSTRERSELDRRLTEYAARSALARAGGERAWKEFTAGLDADKLALLREKYTEDELARLFGAGLITAEGTIRGAPEVLLGKPPADADVPAIERVLASDEKYAPSRAAGELGHLHSTPEVLRVLAKALSHGDTWVRYSAVWSAGNLGSPEALGLVEKALEDPAKEVRGEAASMLGLHGAHRFLASMAKALEDKDKLVRGEALRALGNSGGEEVLALLERSLASRHDDVRSRAVEAIAAIDGERGLAACAKALKDESQAVATSAVRTTGTIGGPRTVPLLEGALSNRQVETRAWAVREIGSQRTDAALAALINAMSHQDSIVRSVAAQQLGRFRHQTEQAVAALVPALRDTEEDVRGYAASSLGRLGGEKARDALLARLPEEASPRALYCIDHCLRQSFADDQAVKKALERRDPVPKPAYRPRPEVQPVPELPEPEVF
jgi:RNA polymerase sigma factor (sigma-70 family)